MTNGTEQSLMAEMMELEAWADLMDAMPDETKMMIGGDCSRIDGALSISARNIPLVTFNRVMGFGLGRPADAPLLQEIAGHIKRVSAPVAQVQIAPFATPAGFETVLANAGFQRAPANWAKMGRKSMLRPRSRRMLSWNWPAWKTPAPLPRPC